jgi:hypothetical protein
MWTFRCAKTPGRHPSAAPLLAAALMLAGGCGRGHSAAGPNRLRVSVRADTSRDQALAIRPPVRASVWMERTSTAPPPLLGPARLGDLPPPNPAPDPVPDTPPPSTDGEDAALQPPLLRSAGTLRVPPRAARESIELDVRVDERGEVTEARLAGGGADTSLIGAARRCALGMRFYPALRGGKPVAVWCRQRFDFGKR